ncbi:hypothetical protein A2673_00370 [Candidatus Kaiserbacteria bacterium RIFCSPHIGHO2_01_FULL_50_13]|uniref:Uncharacterized protein n=1 Tax=Candidatus Kaiserbacteria bacterium RIFCSPLOWO2_01_FULL_50_24 TaxID=1798507 RepID=A0A1F6EI32_9BACT|nr:MAG: hypothetical protein A2673_00370 [Candidatus Kaiserbacteria bacterium RIFCSPHIGHO2_01_FULL_50_13]OGG73301.1 MAG: hypothetical protein A3A34_03405 [Candidatus Kaiserbacteria bacterium RIFCSPLOWO2_01_FULL_50_24]OGG81209.1 MAG: hypothetical protein A3H74_00845 [Candidatus Kaiserbacteria bacterium RIFCSPLOWO2_02_FULL_51_13]
MQSNFSLRQLFLFLFALLVVLFAASLISAWTGPTQSPPDGNVPAPINVGSVDQVKNAGLSLDALAVFGSQYISGKLGIGVENSTVSLDVAGSIRMRGGGSPLGGKVLVSTDSSGTLEWATISYQVEQTSGPHDTYNLKATQTPGTPLYLLVQDMVDNGNVTVSGVGTPYNDAATRARMCYALTGGNSDATVLTYTTDSYASPGDNHVYKWIGTRWVRYGANGNNSLIRVITCKIPGGLRITTDSGTIFTF